MQDKREKHITKRTTKKKKQAREESKKQRGSIIYRF
jgi:hypothetical protein